MPRLIKDNAIIEDSLDILPKDYDGEIPGTPSFVPLAYWRENRDLLRDRSHLGVWLDSDEEIESIAEDLPFLPRIAINFPAFSDGRGFSVARLARERYGFQGEIRAIGHVIRDQLFYLQRCGFNAFQLREGTDLERALDSLRAFSLSYQAATDNRQPLFRKRA